jgi:sugar lactone lactonase YvrE
MTPARRTVPALLLLAAVALGCPARPATQVAASTRPRATARKPPSPSPSPAPTATAAPEPTASPTASPSPTPTPTPTPVPSPTPTPFTIETFAGSGPVGLSGGGFAEGPRATAQFSFPEDVVAAPGGILYVCDTGNNRIRKIAADGTVSTLAGQATAGYVDATGADARFDFPVAIALDAAGDLYVADSGNHKIRKVTAAGIVTTFTGTTRGNADGARATAMLDRPMGVAVDKDGSLYVSDTYNHRVVKVATDGFVTTVAGGDVAAFVNGTGPQARFNRPHDLVVAPDGIVYVADSLNHCIRRIEPAAGGAKVTTYAGVGAPNVATTGGQLVDGLAAEARFFRPQALALAPDGDLYVADQLNHRLRVVRRAKMVVETVAGADPGSPDGGHRDGPAAQAFFAQPFGLAFEPVTGRLFVADTGNSMVRAAVPTP